MADIAAGEALSQYELEYIHQHKTADLFCAAIRMGAIAAGATKVQLDNLTIYGANLGRAFQIIDDILDAADPNDDSCSCIGIYGLDGAKNIAAELTNNAAEAIITFGETSEVLEAIAYNMLERTF